MLFLNKVRLCVCVCGQVAFGFTSPSLSLLTLRPHTHPHHFPLLPFTRLPFIPGRVLVHSALLTSPHWCTHCKIKRKDLLLFDPSSPTRVEWPPLVGPKAAAGRGAESWLEQGVLQAREGSVSARGRFREGVSPIPNVNGVHLFGLSSAAILLMTGWISDAAMDKEKNMCFFFQICPSWTAAGRQTSACKSL